MFPQLSELDTPRLTLAGEAVTLCSCSRQWRASITGARPVLRNCVGGVIVGSTGHRAGLSNEGNTTLPHTSTPAQPSPIPGPIARVNHAVGNRSAVQWAPGGIQAIRRYGAAAGGIMTRLMNSVGFVYKSSREQILILIPESTAEPDRVRPTCMFYSDVFPLKKTLMFYMTNTQGRTS